MKKAELFEIFKGMFPDFAKCAKNTKLIGSKSIAIEMENGKSLIFMYYDQDNWTFGTKVWRRKPEPTPPKKISNQFHSKIAESTEHKSNEEES